MSTGGTPKPAVACIILAAGRGRRLQRGPKAWVQWEGKTLLEHAVTSARAAKLDPIVCALPPESEVLDLALGATPVPSGVAVVRNTVHASGPLGSASLALSVIFNEPRACVLMHVDHPFISESTINALVAAAQGAAHEGSVPLAFSHLVPTHNGRRGHPILLGSAACAAVRDAGQRTDITLRDVLNEVALGGSGVVEVPVDDPGILRNINHESDL